MSESAEAVRQRMAVGERRRRRLAERLGLRFPRATRFLSRLVLRRPPRSRLRRGVVRRAAEWGHESLNRGDVDAAFLLYHPEVVLEIPSEFVSLGFDRIVRGLEERKRFQRSWNSEWGETRFDHEHVIDMGDRLLLLGRTKSSGLSSEVRIDREWATLFTLADGQVVREQDFMDHRRGLEAAGLSS